MPSRIGPVHVAITKREYKGKVYRSYLLRRTYREGEKVRHETLGNISHLPASVIDLIMRALKGEVFFSADESFVIERSLPHGHVLAVLGTLTRLGLDKILDKKQGRNKTLVMGMLVARILEPCSKLATARGLGEETLSTTLGDLLGIKSVQVEELYKALDWLLGRQARIEAALAQRYLTEGSLVLYDVTSTYFEGRKCPLAKLGHSRDGKKGKPQIVFGILCTQDGCPVAVEVFEGNTSDPTTLAIQIEKIRSRFGLSHVVVVGDRGMITEARIREELKGEGLDWITALRAPAIRKLINSGSLQLSLLDHSDMAELTDPTYPGERLIVCKNPLLADERSRKREDLLRSTERDLDTIVAATVRPSRSLKGRERIMRRVDRALDKFKMRKHFRVRIEERSFSYERDQEGIAKESALDGFYVIRTSVARETLSPEDAVRAYKGLSTAERAFRTLKSIELSVRPIYHRLAERVKAHVFLCMLAYHLEWHMKKALAPMLFEDDRKPEGEALRGSVVSPARRSPGALAKSQRRQTEDGMPTHSFRTLLSDLATLTRNSVHLRPSSNTFTVCATPTSIQKKAFDLLAVSLKV